MERCRGRPPCNGRLCALLRSGMGPGSGSGATVATDPQSVPVHDRWYKNSSPASGRGQGEGPLSRQRKRRAKPGKRPSRREARPRPLPPSGRGERRPPARCRNSFSPACGRGQGEGPLSRQRERRAKPGRRPSRREARPCRAPHRFRHPGPRALPDSHIAPAALWVPLSLIPSSGASRVSRDGGLRFGAVLRYAPAGAVATQDEGKGLGGGKRKDPRSKAGGPTQTSRNEMCACRRPSGRGEEAGRPFAPSDEAPPPLWRKRGTRSIAARFGFADRPAEACRAHGIAVHMPP